MSEGEGMRMMTKGWGVYVARGMLYNIPVSS